MSNDATRPKRRFVGRTTAGSSKAGSSIVSRGIPDNILNDVQLNQAIALLPANYSFEIHKTIHHIRKNNALTVALQMPEGLLMYACAITDIIERQVFCLQFSGAHGLTSYLPATASPKL